MQSPRRGWAREGEGSGGDLLPCRAGSGRRTGMRCWGQRRPPAAPLPGPAPVRQGADAGAGRLGRGCPAAVSRHGAAADLKAVGGGPVQGSAPVPVPLVEAPPRGDGAADEAVQGVEVGAVVDNLHAPLPPGRCFQRPAAGGLRRTHARAHPPHAPPGGARVGPRPPTRAPQARPPASGPVWAGPAHPHARQ